MHPVRVVQPPRKSGALAPARWKYATNLGGTQLKHTVLFQLCSQRQVHLFIFTTIIYLPLEQKLIIGYCKTVYDMYMYMMVLVRLIGARITSEVCFLKAHDAQDSNSGSAFLVN